MSRLCMKEISRALIEMISDESPYASKDMQYTRSARLHLAAVQSYLQKMDSCNL